MFLVWSLTNQSNFRYSSLPAQYNQAGPTAGGDRSRVCPRPQLCCLGVSQGGAQAAPLRAAHSVHTVFKGNVVSTYFSTLSSK